MAKKKTKQNTVQEIDPVNITKDELALFKTKHPFFNETKMNLRQVVYTVPEGQELPRPPWHSFVYGGKKQIK